MRLYDIRRICQRYPRVFIVMCRKQALQGEVSIGYIYVKVFEIHYEEIHMSSWSLKVSYVFTMSSQLMFDLAYIWTKTKT